MEHTVVRVDIRYRYCYQIAVTVAIASYTGNSSIRNSDVKELPEKTCDPVVMDRLRKLAFEKSSQRECDLLLDGAKDGNDGRGI